MIWFCAILVGALVSAADIFLLAENKSAKTCIHAVIRDVLTVNLSAFFIMKNVFKRNFFLHFISLQPKSARCPRLCTPPLPATPLYLRRSANMTC